jgi:hypothetical protein
MEDHPGQAIFHPDGIVTSVELALQEGIHISLQVLQVLWEKLQDHRQLLPVRGELFHPE